MRIIETVAVIYDSENDTYSTLYPVTFAIDKIVWVRPHSDQVTQIVFVGDDNVLLVRMSYPAMVTVLAAAASGEIEDVDD